MEGNGVEAIFFDPHHGCAGVCRFDTVNHVPRQGRRIHGEDLREVARDGMGKD